ncbi:MAG: glycosyltransferase family 4 protein, partial [Pirellulaceae bacterium]|nr:glycosyltransferase family 4 protein [Pirellulaceae bacterium]
PTPSRQHRHANMPHPTPDRRPRVLMLAYCCSPYHGSEEGMGWNFATQAARYCDTTVICEEHKFGGQVGRYLAEHGEIPGLRFVFVPERAWAKHLWRTPGGGYLSYNLWHRRALQAARRLDAEQPFDLVHQVNIIGFREPGYLWKLDAPFVWGPVGGTQNYPTRFLPEAGVGGAIKELFRTIANRAQLKFGSRIRAAARRASALLAANSSNLRDLESFGVQPRLFPEVHSTPRQPRDAERPDDELRLYWSGLFTPNKALSIAIKALAQLPPDVNVRLRVAGCGAQEKRWRRLARRLRVDDRIEWLGWLSHEQSLQQFGWADAFVFTSLRDTTGTVVLESLSAGAPVICFDHQGVGDVIDASCGVKVAVSNPRQAVREFAAAIDGLSRSPDQLQRLRRGAERRAAQFTADDQGRSLMEVYQSILPHEMAGILDNTLTAESNARHENSLTV